MELWPTRACLHAWAQCISAPTHVPTKQASRLHAACTLQEEFPGTAVQTDDDIDAYILSSAHSGNALVGTCALGTCVSPTDLTLKGVSGVRVVDASVLPRITGGQTTAPTVMVAERAAAVMTGSARIGGKPAAGKSLVAA